APRLPGAPEPEHPRRRLRRSPPCPRRRGALRRPGPAGPPQLLRRVIAAVPVRYLSDTNILGELARPRPNAGVVEWARSVPGIYLSSITVEEVFYGLSWKPRPKTLRWFEDFLDKFCVVLPVDERIARAGGALRG